MLEAARALQLSVAITAVTLRQAYADAPGQATFVWQMGYAQMGLFPGRVTYVIDQEGIIRQIFSVLFASDEHVRQALIAVGAGRG